MADILIFTAISTLQGSASTLLAFLEREKELLRIFLKVSQMENTILRRMNLSSFLMVSHTISSPSSEDEPQLFSHGESYNSLTILGG